MKIYKYTSLSSGVAILKSGGVVLNNPKNFNDPNDCSFVQDEKDKNKVEKLITDYFMFKVIDELVSNNKLNLNKISKIIFNGLKKEIDAMKWILNKNPYFERMCGFNLIAKMVGSKSREINSLVDDAKREFQKKMDVSIENAKESALVSCFSKRNNSMLMWSHYACSHHGVCFEYEKPDSVDFKDVIYQSNRPTMKMYKAASHAIALDILNKKESPDETTKYLKETLEPFFVKSIDWSYENEVRCLFSKEKLSDNISFNGKHYILNMEYPTAIYVGCNAAGEELDHLYRLAENRGIPIYFMKKDEDTFDVIVDEKYNYEPNKRKTDKEITLLRLVNDINNCLDSKSYLAGFTASLVIPGICSKVECSKVVDSKERYIKWCNTYLPCTSRGPDSDGIAYLTGEILWNIKEKLLSEASVDVFQKYGDFNLEKIVLRTEERNGHDIYCDLLGETDITVNLTKFCADMIYQAQRCYKKHKEEIINLNQLPIEDYDAKLESMHECSVATDRINKLFRGEK